MLPHVPRPAVPLRPAYAPAAEVGGHARAARAASPTTRRSRSCRETLDAAGSRHPGFPAAKPTSGCCSRAASASSATIPRSARPRRSSIIVKPHVDPPADVYDERRPCLARPRSCATIPRSLNPLIKSNNLLNNALAMQHALKQGAFEAVMRNHRGEIAECSQSNLFIVKSGTAMTPPIDAGLLRGHHARVPLRSRRRDGRPDGGRRVRDEDLLGADEAFLTSTTREVVPIVLVDDAPHRHRPSRTGHPRAAGGFPPTGGPGHERAAGLRACRTRPRRRPGSHRLLR